MQKTTLNIEKIHKKILLVDDDADDQFFFTEALCDISTEIGYDIAVNGVDALKRLDDFTTLPDLIFMDVNMPVMNGIVCLGELQKNERFNSIPVVILSTAAFDNSAVNALGAAAYMRKPAGMAEWGKNLLKMLKTNFGKGALIAQ